MSHIQNPFTLNTLSTSLLVLHLSGKKPFFTEPDIRTSHAPHPPNPGIERFSACTRWQDDVIELVLTGQLLATNAEPGRSEHGTHSDVGTGTMEGQGLGDVCGLLIDNTISPHPSPPICVKPLYMGS